MMEETKHLEVRNLVDHLFRHKSAQVLAVLTCVFGLEHLQLAEDVVQDTLVKALQQWPYTGVPRNPGGWLIQVAKNRALDVLRRDAVFRGKQQSIATALENKMSPAVDSIDPKAVHFQDEQLTMMFTCCHPAFPSPTQTALILKNLCGFSTAEIARAFLSEETAIAQRLVRAKRKIVKETIGFETPRAPELRNRIETVLQTLYLLFNEGYGASEGDNLIRRELCEEAIRLTSMLAGHPVGNLPSVHALLSLMLFQTSRLSARVDSHGNLLLLAEQDRSLRDESMIRSAFHHLRLSQNGDQLTEYHLQAAIASCHAAAISYETTDWKKIGQFYDLLLDLNASPIYRLNRAVAIAMVEGPETGLSELRKLDHFQELQNYYLFHATYADFFRRIGDMVEARDSYQKALRLATTRPEKEFLAKRLRDLKP